MHLRKIRDGLSAGTLPPRATSRELLRIVERFGISGTWSWTLPTNQQIWSPGLYRILGVDPNIAPDYSLLYRLVHPDDRNAQMAPAEVRLSGLPDSLTFRLLRPDGSIRTVVSNCEVRFSPDGRPLLATGAMVDVSDRELLRRALQIERQRKRAIFERTGAFTSATAFYPFTDFSQEWLDLVGIHKDELIAEPTLPVVKGEREYWRDHGRKLYLDGLVVQTAPHIVRADGQILKYRFLMIPMRGSTGEVDGWTNYVYPAETQLPLPNDIAHSLEQLIEGRHVRAARALLDWSMNDLAMASGLSLSTVRRVEESALVGSSRNCSGLLDALRLHGIRFSISLNSTIVLGLNRRTI